MSRPFRKSLKRNLKAFVFYAYFVYIVQSELGKSFYKGYSENLVQRLAQHNNGEANYTSFKTPWKLVYVEELTSKRDAIIREKNLKKATIDRIVALIAHPKNIVKRFVEY